VARDQHFVESQSGETNSEKRGLTKFELKLIIVIDRNRNVDNRCGLE
jgi:hypothetical protein